MNKEQAEVINATQQVLRCVVVSLGALNPQAMPAFSRALRAAAGHEDLMPVARQMLDDLAKGVEKLTGTSAGDAH